MDNYKIVISSGKFYKEIILDHNAKRFCIGSNDNCDLVLKGATDFAVVLERSDNDWSINCEGSIYFLYSGVTKMISKMLNHGDELLFKSEGDGAELFNLSFILNFAFYNKKYDYSIDIQNTERVVIGRDSRFSIFLKDELIGTDYIEILE